MLMKKNRLFMFLALMLFSTMTFAQGYVKGVIKDADTRETLVGATIAIQGTTTGTITEVNGDFKLQIPEGDQTIEISFVGYTSKLMKVNIADGKTKNLGSILLEAKFFGLTGINIVADRAKERETPVAFTDVKAAQIEEQLGSRDIPMVMNATPSVYATMQGGGAGDARISVRGFNQRNVAIMINGVPINDMENGWVYWSNWDGVGDATSSIQMQRGLSAVNLATPSIGGTMNIITNPAKMEAGFKIKQEFGSGKFLKTTIFGNTGLINGKYALSAGVVKKSGVGQIDKTWTDAYAYYLGASWNINKSNRLEFYAVGAPQRHGQNLYKQNIAAYDHAFAEGLDDYDPAALDDYDEAGLMYNENWGAVSNSYTGQQYWNGKAHDRYNEDFINERENYFHKPQINLNWYTQWSEKLTQYTIAYYSGGTGGGTGTYGSVKWDYSGPSRFVDFDATIANNSVSDTAKGILRNSVNNQWTIGAISKFNYKASDKLKLNWGIDWRKASIHHFREVRDLLGGSFYIYNGDDFAASSNKVLGDKIAYDNTNTVDWFGGYLQGEYKSGNFSAYGMAGYSMIKYTYTDHFTEIEDGGELFIASDWIGGMQIKGGAAYNLNESFSIFANAGYVTKVPIFDNVIDDYNGVYADNPENEKFTSFEGGINYVSLDQKLVVKANYYYTLWTDRARSLGVTNEDGTEGIIFLKGMDQLHSGFEFEVKYKPVKFVQFDAVASLGNWNYTSDVEGTYRNYDEGETEIPYHYYVEGLKVGDAPQTQFVFAASIFPVKGLQIQGIIRHYRNNHADWDPFSRTDDPSGDIIQSWIAPAYSVIDLHASYNLPLDLKNFGFQVFAHVFNLTDVLYIQDAVDNSAYNGFDHDHDADDAEVYFGLPRLINAGLIINIK